MPTYQYACTACDERLEVVQKFSDDPLSECPACSGRLRKVFSPVGVVFKGSGFYRTDSRADGRKDTAKAASSTDSGSKDGSTSGAGSSGSSGATSGGDKPAASSGSSSASGSTAKSGDSKVA